MMYPFMTIKDDIEVVHSDMKPDGTVKVYFEQPIYLGFNSVECILPQYEWKNNSGFTQDDMDYFDEFVHSLAHVILDLSQKGGFDNASGF